MYQKLSIGFKPSNQTWEVAVLKQEDKQTMMANLLVHHFIVCFHQFQNFCIPGTLQLIYLNIIIQHRHQNSAILKMDLLLPITNPIN